jgi:hypothetical protein
MKKLIIVFLILHLFFVNIAFAQDDTNTSGETLSVEQQLESLLADLSSLQKALKKNRRKKPIARDIKVIARKIIRAVNSVPPETCMKTLREAMDEFYEVVTKLELGISCGPVVLPPFLPGDDGDPLVEPLVEDCLPPPDEFERLQIGGPFGGAFADVNPVYDTARDLFQIDVNDSEISDVCEGEIE